MRAVDLAGFAVTIGALAALVKSIWN